MLCEKPTCYRLYTQVNWIMSLEEPYKSVFRRLSSSNRPCKSSMFVCSLRSLLRCVLVRYLTVTLWVTGTDCTFVGMVAVQSMSKHIQELLFVSSFEISLHLSNPLQVRSSTRSRCMTPAWRRLIACPWQPWWTSSSCVCMGGFHQRSTRWTTSRRYKKRHKHTYNFEWINNTALIRHRNFLVKMS